MLGLFPLETRHTGAEGHTRRVSCDVFPYFGARHTAEANPTRPLRILAQEVGSELRLRCVLYYAQKGCPWSRPRVSLSDVLHVDQAPPRTTTLEPTFAFKRAVSDA